MTNNSSYQASACGPGCEDTLDHGTLWFSEAGASFRGTAASFTLPAEGLQITRAGATGDTIRLVHPSHPGWFISTGDLSVLTNPVLQSRSDLRRSMKSGKRKGLCCLGGCLTLIVIAVLLVMALVRGKDAMVGGLANHFPPELEQRIGDVIASSMVPESAQLTDPELTAGLKAIAQPVLDAIPKDEGFTSFTLYLSRDAEPNAFALPGGHIVVNAGLIALADTPEEVAGVIAHEAGHAVLRHGLQSIISRLGTAALLNLMMGDVTGLSGILIEGGNHLLNQKYSRDFERQADDKAWDYLQKANINPAGLTTFFSKLETLQAGATPPAILSTHPATRERMDALEAKSKAVNKKQSYQKIDIDYPAYKAKLKEATTANSGTL